MNVMDYKYNGWTNRETWLVNLYFEETLREWITENHVKDAFGLKECFEDFLDEILEVGKLNGFLVDYIDFSLINYHELFEEFRAELEQELE
jgi:hypothetical protein